MKLATMMLILATSAVFSQAAFAAGPATGVRIAVGDLDLSRSGDAAVFEQRVEVAAHRFCANYKAPGTRISQGEECLRAIREEAVDKLPRGQRTALASARGARPDSAYTPADQ